MKIIFIAAYFWVAFWTAFLVLGQYKPEEAAFKKIVGPILFGAGWPIFLPFAVLGDHGPEAYGIKDR